MNNTTQAAAAELFTRQLRLEHDMGTARERSLFTKLARLQAEYEFVRAERQRVLRGK